MAEGGRAHLNTSPAKTGGRIGLLSQKHLENFSANSPGKRRWRDIQNLSCKGLPSNFNAIGPQIPRKRICWEDPNSPIASARALTDFSSTYVTPLPLPPSPPARTMAQYGVLTSVVSSADGVIRHVN